MQKRLLYNELLKYLDHKNALVITGMRQVGKTTLMKQVYNDIGGQSSGSILIIHLICFILKMKIMEIFIRPC